MCSWNLVILTLAFLGFLGQDLSGSVLVHLLRKRMVMEFLRSGH